MPASSSIKPRRIKSRIKQKKAAWCLNVPAELSPTGKRQRLFFDTETLANAEALRLKTRQDNFGTSLSKLSPERIAQAAAAFKLLDEHKIDLMAVVSAHIKAHKQRSASVAWLELFNQFLQAKQSRSDAYRSELEITRDRFPTLHNLMASDISHRDIEPLLAGLGPSARNACMRYLRAVFNFGIKREFLTENPVNRLDFADRPRKEVVTIPVDRVRAMLEHALAEDLRLLPFLALGLFCGVRPDGELLEIEWTDIKSDEIVIRPEVSKTNRRRFIDLSDNAKAWLNAYAAQGGAMAGKVVQFTASELRTHRTANWKAAEISEWPQQGMRHTFCSCWLAQHGDVNKLVLMSGHDSVDTMWRAYHAGIPEAEAARFWSIMPPSSLSNLVRFTDAL